MHTAIVLGAGFLLLAGCSLVARLLGGPEALPKAALVFLPLWFVGASLNMYIGVKKAGYSPADEAPIFALVFAIPAAAALLLWWKLR